MTLIFREHTGEQLAKTKLERNEADVIKDARELGKTMEIEQAKRTQKKVATRWENNLEFQRLLKIKIIQIRNLETVSTVQTVWTVLNSYVSFSAGVSVGLTSFVGWRLRVATIKFVTNQFSLYPIW